MYDLEAIYQEWPKLNNEVRISKFTSLNHGDAHELFSSLSSFDQSEIIRNLPQKEQSPWMRMLAPDDVADVLGFVKAEEKDHLLSLIDYQTRLEVIGLLDYNEDVAGGLMNPRFARIRASQTVDEAIIYLRKQNQNKLETMNDIYVLDNNQKLLGIVSLIDLFKMDGKRTIENIMQTGFKSINEHTGQEDVASLFARYDLVALPVLNTDGQMVGIVTVDDILDVVQQEATEDIQKMGGMEPLDIPYLQTSLTLMMKKRGAWLTLLFFGQMFTETAMGYNSDIVTQVAILTLFVPLIISSGGNSGSQTSTLVIRAMALQEVHFRDIFRVLKKEFVTGLLLGSILAIIGFLKIFAWEYFFNSYGDSTFPLALTLSISLIGVVTWGTISGALLPFIIKKLGFDPASASSPFVATLVDVTGLIIYFAVAQHFFKVL